MLRYPEGAPITVREHSVDWVVIERGAAQLRLQTFESRTKMLLSIAHHDFNLTEAKEPEGTTTGID